jgi:hypothetical protein
VRIVIRHRDLRVVSGYATAFDPKDGSVMVMLSPTSPAGNLVSLEIVEVLVLEPTDGKPLLARGKKEPSPGVRVVFADGRVLAGVEGSIDAYGVWMRPPEDRFSHVFVPKGAARYVELLDEPEDDASRKMWAFVNDSTPTDEVELPTGPTDVTDVVSPKG